MEAEAEEIKQQDLQPAILRTKRANGVSYSIDSLSLKTQEEIMFQCMSKGNKDQCLKSVRWKEFPLT